MSANEKNKQTVRKNFFMQSDLEPRLKAYCKKTGWHEAQVFNLSIRTFLDNEDMKKVIQTINPEDFVKQLIQEAYNIKKENPEFADLAESFAESAKQTLPESENEKKTDSE